MTAVEWLFEQMDIRMDIRIENTFFMLKDVH